MKPNHLLHEIGFGSGRSARWFVDYLAPGHYSGNDPSSGRLGHTRQLIEATGLTDKKPKLICSTDNNMNWLDGKKVDFVFCNHVFTHMPMDDIADLFSNLHNLMGEKTVFLFTYSDALDREPYREGVKDWLHDMKFYHSLAEQNGLQAENITDVMRGFGDSLKITKYTRLVKVTRQS